MKRKKIIQKVTTVMPILVRSQDNAMRAYTVACRQNVRGSVDIIVMIEAFRRRKGTTVLSWSHFG